MQIFYYGIWCAGLVGVVSLFMVYSAYKKTLGDIGRLPSPKGKWMKEFNQDYHQLKSKHTEVKNPAIFIEKRIKGRKIGPISLYRLKGVVWYASVLCLAFMGLALFSEYQDGTWKLTAPLSHPLLLAAGIGIPIGLLVIRQLLGLSFKEEMIRDGLQDYIENLSQTPKPVQQVFATEPIKSDDKVRRAKGNLIKPPTAADNKQTAEQQDELVDHITQGIKETAATNSKYSHLLSEEEQGIVRDVIKEFLT